MPDRDPVIPGAVSLRPMPFSTLDVGRLVDPVFEPLWAGRRALALVRGDWVELRDEHGDALDGFDDLRVALAAAVAAEEAVVDGYLFPGPFPGTAGREAPIGLDAVTSPAEVGRQFVLGSGGARAARREEQEAAAARNVRVDPDAITSFVAIDLVWLDGMTLVDVPLQERKRLLDSVVIDGELVRRTVAVREPVGTWFGQWRALGFREYAVKAANSRYRPGDPDGGWATKMIPKR